MLLTRCLAVAAALALPIFAGAQSSGVRSFVVDDGASDVHWRVYKAGPLARLGHNHVVSVVGLDGTIELEADGSASWALSFDVADLVVDDPELRSQYGEEFSSKPSADDIAGTKRNMLSETVLDGERFTTIRLSGETYDGPMSDASMQVVVEMLGRSIPLEIPASIRVEGDSLVAEGQFSLQHADLGMEPFSVMMGALQVGPQLDFSYSIHAVAADR